MKKTHGFTLIELLLVITLIGALSTGLLVVVDPLEQVRKGRDTTTRGIAAEFFDANQRYYVNYLKYGWTDQAPSGRSLTSAGIGSAITALQDAGELKSNFLTSAGTSNLAIIYVTSSGDDDVNVCFVPQSKGFKVDQNTKYNGFGGLKGACPSLTTTCYYCLK